MQERNYSDLVPFGLGVGAGLLGVWVVVEFFPLFVIGGVSYIVLKGMENTSRKEDNT